MEKAKSEHISPPRPKDSFPPDSGPVGTDSRFFQLIDQAPFAALVAASDRLFYANSYLLSLFALESLPEAGGFEAFLSLVSIPPREREKIGHMAKGIHAPGTVPLSIEVSARTRTGNRLWLGIDLMPVQWEGIRAIYAVFSDLTHQKQAANQENSGRKAARNGLTTSESNYKMLMEQASDGIFLSDSTGHYIEVNPRACEMTGYSSEELLTMEFSDLFDAGELKKFPLQFGVLEEGGTVISQRTFLRKDGSSFMGEISAKKFSDGRLQGFVRDVTERKAIEDELKASRQLLQTVFDTIPIPLYVKDQEGRLTHINQAFVGVYGKNKDTLIGWTMDHLPGFSPDLAAYFTEQDRRVLTDGEVIDVPEISVADRFGEQRIRHVRKVPIRDDEDKIIGLIGLSEDVTERTRAEAAILASEKNYRRLVEGLSLGALITIDNLTVFCNKAVLRMLGLEDAGELMGRDLLTTRFIPEHEAKRLTKFRRDRMEGKEAPDHYVTQALRMDGQTIWVEVFPQIIEWEGRNAILTSLYDITEAKLAEEERDRLAEAVHQAGDLVMITNIDGVIQYVNPAFERVTGYSRDEAVGQKPSLLKSGMQNEGFYKTMWDTLHSGRSWVGNYINRRKDGSTFHVDAIHSPIKNDRGDISHFIAVHHDISERVQLEEQLRQSQKMEAVGQLASGIAHEFNNLLQIIKGYAELALRKMPSGEPLSNDLQHILSASGKAGRLTSHLLAFTRQQSLSKRAVNLNELVESLREVIAPLTGVDIEFDLVRDPNLPRIMADQGMIEQVVMNMIVNARDAMPGGGRLSIETQRARAPEKLLQEHPEVAAHPFVVLKVRDSGEGIRPDQMEKIFDPFFTTKELGKGTGLGLAMAYGIIRQHHGAIEVRSQRGQGTEFSIFLPALIEKIDAAPGGQALDDPFNVLIAEDDSGIQELLVRMLEQGGYKVFRAGHGEEALSIYHRKHQQIDAVVLDVLMPKVGGKEVYTAIRKVNQTLPIIFASGLNIKLQDLGIEDDPHVKIFLKPYRFEDIIEAIGKSLGNEE